MYYTFIQTGEEVNDGQPQKYFKVLTFEDEAKTILIGQNTYVASGVAYDDPEGEFIKTMNMPPPSTVREKNYFDDRRYAYPAIGDQLDMLWHTIDQGLPLDKTSSFFTTISAVKAKHPKPN
jgi:hypothetical protein